MQRQLSFRQMQPPPMYVQNVFAGTALQSSLFMGFAVGQSLVFVPPPQVQMLLPGPGGLMQLQRVPEKSQARPTVSH